MPSNPNSPPTAPPLSTQGQQQRPQQVHHPSHFPTSSSATPASSSSPSSSFGQRMRLFLYDSTVPSTTSSWYHQLLRCLPGDAHVLDVGIGTGMALLAHANVLKAKNITIVGLDTDAAFIDQCCHNITAAKLQSHVRVFCSTVQGFQVPPDGRFFTHVYFGGTYMSIQPSEMRVDELRAAVELLADREDGRIAFAHTFHLRKSAWREWLAPNFAALTSLNTHQFANVVYQGDFEQCLHLANVAVVRTYNLDVETFDDDDDESDNDDGDFCADKDDIGLSENQRPKSQHHQNEQRTNQSTMDSHRVKQKAAKYRTATTSNDRQEESLLIFARSRLYIRQQKETIN